MRQNFNINKSQTSNALKGGESAAVDESNDTIISDAVQLKPLEVIVFGNFDKAMRNFKSVIQKDKVLSLFKEKQRYEKKSDKLRRKKSEAKRKMFENKKNV